MVAYRLNRKWIDKLINSRDVLSREEEKELIYRHCVLGEKEAGKEIILSNQRLVMQIAASYSRRTRGVSLDDLFSEGNIGLIHALKKYDHTRKSRFMAYAKWWVRAEIVRYIMSKRKIVHTETTPKLRMMYSRFRKERCRIEKKIIEEFGESPEHHKEDIESQLAELFAVPIEKVREFEEAGTSVSITGTLGKLSNRTSPEYQRYFGVDPIESQTKDALAKIIREEIETLKPIQRDIIRRRFSIGFDARYHDRESLAKIGRRHNMGGENIRILEARAFERLRMKLKKRLDKATLEELVQ